MFLERALIVSVFTGFLISVKKQTVSPFYRHNLFINILSISNANRQIVGFRWWLSDNFPCGKRRHLIAPICFLFNIATPLLDLSHAFRLSFLLLAVCKTHTHTKLLLLLIAPNSSSQSRPYWKLSDKYAVGKLTFI